MSKSRRQFLVNLALAYFGTSLSSSSHAQQTTAPPPGMPPAFGTAPPVGPEVSPTTFAEAEKLMQVQFTAAERAQGLATGAAPWHHSMSVAPVHARSNWSQLWHHTPAGIRYCRAKHPRLPATNLSGATRTRAHYHHE